MRNIKTIAQAVIACALISGTSAWAMESPLTLAVKYVTYVGENGSPVITPGDAQHVIDEVNQVYSSCSVRFRLEEFVTAHPEDSGLGYHPSTMKELDPIRRQYDDANRLVIINTGKWNKTGGLGADGANAWTMMPGDRPSGTVIESPYASNANLVAHELGHYLNLDHSKDRANLMNPVIYRASTGLSNVQCDRIREAAQGPRKLAIRSRVPSPLPGMNEFPGPGPGTQVISRSLAASAKE